MKVLENEKGLSLIEVVASMLILSIALLLLSNFLVKSFEISGNQDSRQVAMNLARQTVEEWKSGKGTIPKSVTQEEIALADRYLGKPLPFPLLSEVSLLVEKEMTDESKGIELEPLSINDRVYQTYVLPHFIETDQLTLNPLIRIDVKVFSNDALVAELEALVPNPDVGQDGSR